MECMGLGGVGVEERREGAAEDLLKRGSDMVGRREKEELDGRKGDEVSFDLWRSDRGEEVDGG